MSFNITVRAATAAAAIAAAAAEMAKVVETQPVHAADQYAVDTAVQAYVGVLPEDDTRDVVVNVTGSVSTNGSSGDEPVISAASVSVSAHLTIKEPMPQGQA